MRCSLFCFFVVAAVIGGSTVQAQGVIIRPDLRAANVVLEDHSVDAHLEENIATVAVEHVFRNTGNATAEGTFLFPLPPNAHVSRFSMDVDGREMAGELLTAEEARKIYEDIVRRSLDPALLELVGHRSFRASIFPIPPGEKRTIRLRYDAELPREGKMISFLYPLHGAVHTRSAGWPQPRILPIGENPSGPNVAPDDSKNSPPATSVRIEMRSSAPLLTIYSPSHDIDVDRDGDRRAVVSFEGELARENRDFVAYFSVDERELGATLLTHRPYRDKAGYFMLLLSPRVNAAQERVQPKDLVFVLDTSGSMAGEKIEQARDALKYCLNRLGSEDRFGIVAFSSDVDRFRDELLPSSSRRDALYFVDQLEASGGTNIHDALVSAAEMIDGSKRGMVVFLTDGLPSTGVTDEGEIRRTASAAFDGPARVFSFGVGYDVNTRLLDGLSRSTGAPADYISPNENIEERVSTFYEKIRHPLLTDLSFELTGGETYAFAPRSLTDLYRGSQLIVAGRYRQPGDARLVLSGLQDGRRVTFNYDLDFSDEVRERDFVARLWATRRVGQLLDEVRMNGETSALKEEIVALAKEFGLVTPYTSYLVQEEESMAEDVMLRPQDRRGTADMMAAGAHAYRSNASSGASAVAASKAIRAMEAAETVYAPSSHHYATIQGRLMKREASGAWLDDAFVEGDEVIGIKMGSDAYFALLRAYPDAIEFARLGNEITFALGERFVRIGESGLTNATVEELHRMIGNP